MKTESHSELDIKNYLIYTIKYNELAYTDSLSE